ncbi:uncharacterized protein LOC113561756 [Ooceraea biroi]|uniref:uncharacterized protein LOC113561756 n=1 Tax=Ooceraea biroi TaxID=2015173 RepID=UPI000F0757BF|nr:uncharacterized protein LOC113561756 [Ooceraea biroi]
MDYEMERGQKRKDRTSEESEGSDESVGTVIRDTKTEFLGDSSVSIGSQMLEWIGELDELRLREKGLQGKISGDMKELLTRLKTAASGLTQKCVETQERLSNDDREKEIVTLRAETGNLKKTNIELVTTIGRLHETNKRLIDENKHLGEEVRKGWSGRIERGEDVGRDDSIPEKGMDERVKPPLTRGEKGTGKRTDIRIREMDKSKRAVRIIDPQQEKDRALTEQIEELISQRKELRRMRKQGDESTTEETPLPQRTRSTRTRTWAQSIPRTEDESTDGGLEDHFPPLRNSNEWTVVENRRNKGRRMREANVRGKQDSWTPNKEEKRRITRRRPPKTEAVWLSGVKAGITGADILKMAKKGVSLEELGIEEMKTRRTATGATLIEIAGENNKAKADELAAKLKGVFAESQVHIRRPTKKAEIRIIGLDEDTTEEDVRQAIEKFGKGEHSDIKTGRIARTRMGTGIIWVLCPLEVATEVVRIGRIRIGWTSARVEMIEARPIRCFKCLEAGHVRERCTSEIDRMGACFKCGENNHKAAECTNKPHCPACKRNGKDVNHRIGSLICTQNTKKNATTERNYAEGRNYRTE